MKDLLKIESTRMIVNTERPFLELDNFELTIAMHMVTDDSNQLKHMFRSICGPELANKVSNNFNVDVIKEFTLRN